MGDTGFQLQGMKTDEVISHRSTGVRDDHSDTAIHKYYD